MEIDTLEYSRVKATSVSVRLQIFSYSRSKYPTSFLALLPGNDSCSTIEPSSFEFSFSFLPPFYFYLFVTTITLPHGFHSYL
jgi:hypothetical protein